jgi:flagellar export protein FliJ
MTDPLTALHTIRKMQQEKKRRAFAEAQRVRDAQQAKLEAMSERVDAARSSEAGEEAHWVAQRQSWCLQMEMRRRAEHKQLENHSEEAERRRAELQSASRDEQKVEVVVEEAHQAAAIELRRGEERQNNELASQGWWRKCG